MLAFNFTKVDDELRCGIERLAPVIGYEQGSGIEVEGRKSDRVGVHFESGRAVISYVNKVQFFRELGILADAAKRSDRYSRHEDGFFTTLGVMIDTSRCGVPTVDSLKKLFDYLAIFGYTTVFLYTEDTVELEGRPYFGYMRGRYTHDELRSIDDYAYEYGIEVIPCIECYGHMEKYLIWPESWPIMDTKGVLLAREEKTFEFIDQLISTVSSCFRSRYVHIGMDEAWDMGRGKFLDKHGYVPPAEIFAEYMDGLMQITRRHGLTPIMWSDMYFRIGCGRYYADEDQDLPPEVIESIPEDVELVFWHYGESYGCDDRMMKKHNATGRRTWFAGGLWGWVGHFPEHNYALDTTRAAMEACRNNHVKDMMTTIWTNDNAECDTFTNLYGLSFTAELAFDKGADAKKLAERFEAATGGSAEGFYTMSLYHNKYEGETFASYSRRFIGKAVFWQDIMEGLFDSHLIARPLSGHYADVRDRMHAIPRDKWGYLYDLAKYIFDYMATKCEIAERLHPAYRAGDRATLAEIRDTLLPALREKTVRVHRAHKAVWFGSNKVTGWQNLDIRYGGVAARCDTAIELLDDYLSGRRDHLDELDEPRLEKGLSGFIQYNMIATPNIKI